jgi:hypothetical protein
MRPLFVSFAAHRNRGGLFGSSIVHDAPPMKDDQTLNELTAKIERDYGYDKGSLVILSFQRLEDGE